MINTVTTTQIQRKPSVLQMQEGDEPKYIIKNGKIIGVLISPSEADKLSQRSPRLSEEELKKIQNVWKNIDPVAFQEELRKEE